MNKTGNKTVNETGNPMQSHTRALIAASAYAAITGKTVAGLYDHTAAKDLDIAAECQGNRVQGVDGDRATKFGGTLPEIHDDGDNTFVSLVIDGSKASGYDRGSQAHYVAEVTDRLIQLYDYNANAWFAFATRNLGQ